MNKYSHRDSLSKFTNSHKILQGLSPIPSPLSELVELPRSQKSYFNIRLAPVVKGEIGKSHKKTASQDITIANSLAYVSERQPSISSFTVAQNEMVTESLQRILQDHKVHHWFPDLETATMMRSDKDFTQLINKLNRVIYPDLNRRPVFLNEGEPLDFSVDEGQVQLCKTFAKGKRTPLIMKIFKFRGKVLTYVSFFDKNPGPNNYDRFYSSEYFEIRENAQTFKYQYIYFAFKATEDSDFKVTLTFGKISDLNEVKKLKRQLSQLHLGKNSPDSSSPLFVKSKIEKNFVSLNKSIKFLNSHLKAPELKKRAKDWEIKHSQVLSKKKILLIEKMQKNQNFLNKQVIRQKIRKHEQEKQSENEMKAAVQKKWLEFMFFASSLKEIRKKIQETRTKTLKKITFNMKAYQIQKVFKEYTSNMEVQKAVVARARNHLLFFRENVLHQSLKTVKSKIFDFIECISHKNVTTRHFTF
jgi:phage terminase small subunit